jgi:hypothetical protein
MWHPRVQCLSLVAMKESPIEKESTLRTSEKSWIWKMIETIDPAKALLWSCQ